MSVGCSTYCIDCNEEAPEIGDGGMIGDPSIEDKLTYHEDEDWGDFTTYAFGWIYSGLRAISLIPFEVEAYRAFLLKHQGHRKYLSIEGSDSDLEKELDWDNIKKFKYDFDPQDFIMGGYEIVCKDNGESFITTDDELFKRFEPHRLSEENIKTVMRKIFYQDGIYDYIVNTGFSLGPYEDLGRLEKFFRNNGDKELWVRIAKTPEDRTGYSRSVIFPWYLHPSKNPEQGKFLDRYTK